MLKAVTRQARLVDAKVRAINADPAAHGLRGPISTAYFFDHFAKPDDLAVMVTEQDFLDAHRELVPSVSAGELAHYERVRAAFEGSKDKDKDKETSGGAPNGTGVSSASSPSSTSTARLGLLPAGRRTVSGGKGKGKAVASAGSGKGKGKAVALGSEDEFDDDYDEERKEIGEDGEDGQGSSSSGGGYGVRDKGKGKEVAPPIAEASPFGDGTGAGDDGLYD